MLIKSCDIEFIQVLAKEELICNFNDDENLCNDAYNYKASGKIVVE